MESFQKWMLIEIDHDIGIGGLSKIEFRIVVRKGAFRFEMIRTPRCTGIVTFDRRFTVHIQLQPYFGEHTQIDLAQFDQFRYCLLSIECL